MCAIFLVGDIPIDAVQVYTDGSRDYYYRSDSGIYIKSQDHILRIQRRNPGGCSVFRTGHTCSHPRVPRAHQAGLSGRSLAGVGLSDSVRCYGLGLERLTNRGVPRTVYSNSQLNTNYLF
ncbi:hypothetical protein TNCV_1815571 [Trichonephila clavipes]|nr:hypothetical protein TNCV_1815571 [Trichonephila clavipes]